MCSCTCGTVAVILLSIGTHSTPPFSPSTRKHTILAPPLLHSKNNNGPKSLWTIPVLIDRAKGVLICAAPALPLGFSTIFTTLPYTPPLIIPACLTLLHLGVHWSILLPVTIHTSGFSKQHLCCQHRMYIFEWQQFLLPLPHLSHLLLTPLWSSIL